MDWTDEQLARLRQLHDEGLSALVIAEMLTKELRLNVTRNMICGKKERMGLRGGARPGVKPSRPRRVRKGRKVVRAVDSEPMVPREPELPPPTPRSDLDIPPEQRRTIWELENWHCRWPVGGGAAMFYCGSPTADVVRGQPWCPAHKRRAWAGQHEKNPRLEPTGSTQPGATSSGVSVWGKPERCVR